MTRIVAALVLFVLGVQRPVLAQDLNEETIQIGLSTDHVELTAGFSGADLTIFGSVENADPQITRRGGYDVVVVLEGPADAVVVRKKSRVLGVWINTNSETFVNVPISYSLATTRQPQDITDQQNYKRLSLGADSIFLQPLNRHASPVTTQEFTAALRDRKKASALFSTNYGGVRFLSQSLFRATLRLAPDVPVGTHRARAFLFKNGTFVSESSAQLAIRKSGFEQSIYDYAHNDSFTYGIFAVLLAMMTGWLGRLVFRKD